MRLTTVATIGVLPFDGRDSASVTRGWREAGKPSGWRFTTRRQRCDTQAAGAAERGSDAAAEGQSAPMMADLFWHSTQLLAAYAPTYTICHASAHWMASSSVHSAKGHIDAVHRVRQPSHNKGRTSLCGQFLPTDRSSCEQILTQQHVDKPNHEQAMPYRHRVSQSSYNGPLTSSISRFRPTERSLCEPILTNPHLQPPNPAYQPPDPSLCESILAQRHRPARRSPQRALTCLRPPLRRAAARRLRRWRLGCRRSRGTRPRGVAVRG